MTISHFEHSYLDWRTIPCKRRNDLCFCSFQHFFFLLLDSRLDLVKFSECMTWQSIFLFCFFSFSRSHGLSTSDNDAYHKWTSSLKHLFSYEDRFERVGLWFEVYHFCPKKGLWLKSVFEKWVILVNMPQGINQRWFQCITVLRLVFLVIERVLAGSKL